MNKPDFGATPTLASAFEHFLDQALFARRTRESYTDDLAPLLTPYGHAHVSVLTPELVQEYLARQERLAPATYNRRLAALRSFLNFLRAAGEVFARNRSPTGGLPPRGASFCPPWKGRAPRGGGSPARRLSPPLLPSGRYPVEAIHTRLGSAPTPPYRNQRPSCA